MFEIASQMILCLLLAALIGFIIGYLLGKSTCTDDNCGQSTEDLHNSTSSTAVATKTTSVATTAIATDSNKPVLLSGPRNGEKDNLSRIKGIGAKIEETLNEIGIYHFDQIANWDEENIAWADSTLGFPGRAHREQWVAQATALAAGEETEFSKRVDKGQVSSSHKS